MTSRTSARAAPPRARSGRTRTGCAPSSSSAPPSTRLSVMTQEAANRAHDRHGRRPAPRHRASAAGPVTAPSSATRPAASVHGWVAHLRAGGTTPWLAWTDPGAGDEPAGRALPGAQQLELLRRINLARRRAHGPVATATPRTRLADRVLAAPAAGRGKADLPLIGAGGRRFRRAARRPRLGRRPRAAPGREHAARRRPRRARRRPGAPRRCRGRGGDASGSSATRSSPPPLREHLLGRGRPEGGPRPFVVAVGGPARRPARPHLDAALLRARQPGRGATGCASGASATSCPPASTSTTPYAAGAGAGRSSGSSPTSTGCPSTSASAGCRRCRCPAPTRPSWRGGSRRSSASGSRPTERPGADADAADPDARQRRRARRRTRQRSTSGSRRPRHAWPPAS